MIDSGPGDASTNMAVDEAILRGYSGGGSPPTFRIYSWQPSAISFGYSQDASRCLDLYACRRSGRDVVRRITGGGIIDHQEEITYSLVASAEDLGVTGRVVRSYKTISSFLIEFYRRLGLDAAYACDASDATGERFGQASALCYASKEKYDIVIGTKKIGGSAQKRTRGVIFQHGSIPLRRPAVPTERFLNSGDTLLNSELSNVSPEQPAYLEELTGAPADGDELGRLLVDSFCATFGVGTDAAGLTGYEKRSAEDLRERKYKSIEWTMERIDVASALYDRSRAAAAVGR
jgi:lipoate-protein ligase A